MGYFSKKEEKGEGASIIDGNENNVEKSECGNCMICVCHNTNTCSKELFKEVNVQDITIKGTKKDVLDFIMKDEITDGFEDLAQFQKEPEPETPYERDCREAWAGDDGWD